MNYLWNWLKASPLAVVEDEKRRGAERATHVLRRLDRTDGQSHISLEYFIWVWNWLLAGSKEDRAGSHGEGQGVGMRVAEGFRVSLLAWEDQSATTRVPEAGGKKKRKRLVGGMCSYIFVCTSCRWGLYCGHIYTHEETERDLGKQLRVPNGMKRDKRIFPEQIFTRGLRGAGDGVGGLNTFGGVQEWEIVK